MAARRYRAFSRIKTPRTQPIPEIAEATKTVKIVTAPAAAMPAASRDASRSDRRRPGRAGSQNNTRGGPMAQQLDSDGTSSPLASAARHWKLLAGATVLGAVVGGGVGLALPVQYTAETRLAVGAGNDSAYAVAGYPLAARDLAQNYARWVTTGAADGSWNQPDVTEIAANPIPESGVIRLEATSPDENAAVAGAAAVSEQLQQTVDEVMASAQPDTALQEFRKLSPQVIRAQSAVSAAENRFGRSPTAANADALAEARAVLAEAELIQGAQGDRYRRMVSDPVSVSQLTEIAPAASMGSNRDTNIQVGAAGGAGIGLIGAFIAGALRDFRGRRTRRNGVVKEDVKEAGLS